jgi:hypothetical protein
MSSIIRTASPTNCTLEDTWVMQRHTKAAVCEKILRKQHLSEAGAVQPCRLQRRLHFKAISNKVFDAHAHDQEGNGHGILFVAKK